MFLLKFLLQKISPTQLSPVMGTGSRRLAQTCRSSGLFKARSFRLVCAVGFASTAPLLWLPQTAQSQSVQSNLCAVPGKDGVDSGITSIVNSYYAGPDADTIVDRGATTIPIGAINSQGNQTTITPGDLLLVIQMQDADINFTDTANYGSGAGTGFGATAIGSTGFYEYVVAQSSVGAAGGTLQIRGARAGGGLINSYRQQAADITSHGQRTYQVIRVPQFISTTLSGTIRSPGSWNGKSGGIVALDVVNTLTMSGGTIEVQDKGFRGGGGTPNTDTYPFQEDESFRTDGNVPRGGAKGEGIAGTPLFVFNGSTTINTRVDGYPRLKSADSYPTIGGNVNGGTFNGQLGGTTGVTRGATVGSPGNVTAGTSIGSAQIPGILSGADCNAKISIVKRITEIAANRTQNPNIPTTGQQLNQVLDRPSFAADDPAPANNWPSNFLIGAYDAGRIQPGDTVEYTIYFLNSSGMNAKNVRICDRIVGSQTFLNDAYGAGKDIEYKLGTNPIRYLTRSVNTAIDRAQLDSSTGLISNCPAPTINGTNR